MLAQSRKYLGQEIPFLALTGIKGKFLQPFCSEHLTRVRVFPCVLVGARTAYTKRPNPWSGKIVSIALLKF